MSKFDLISNYFITKLLYLILLYFTFILPSPPEGLLEGGGFLEGGLLSQRTSTRGLNRGALSEVFR